MSNLHDAAYELHQNGVTVIPVRGDGSKAPALKRWQDHRTTEQDIDRWFGGMGPGGYDAMGIVTGPASGNLEMVEIEGAAAHRVPELATLASDSGLGELWARVNAGWLELSPSGGVHWFYRVEGDPIPGNTKLANALPVVNEAGRRIVPTLAETRGTGGQSVAAPTPGTAHPSGKPWVRLRGGPATVPTLTLEERGAFMDLMRTLDEQADLHNHTVPTDPGLLGDLLNAPKGGNSFEGTTPGDDYENKTDWADILGPAGWTLTSTRGRTRYWARPGKTIGISATTGNAPDRDRLFVFSSSTEFDPGVSITKLHAYTVLNHGGDHSAAAAALRKNGFGEPQQVRHPKYDNPQTPASAPNVDPVAAGNVLQLPAPEVDSQPVATVVPGLSLALTDDSNAMELIRRYGDKLRYNADQGRWLAWTGHRWDMQPSHGGYARELAKETARQLPTNGPEGSEKCLKHKRYSLSERGISSMLNQARTDPLITVVTNELDAHPWELNTPTGIVNLRTGELMPSDPAKLHTRSTAVGPDPAADPGVWDTFLEQTFPDPTVRDYMQRLAGYSSIGEVLAHVLPFAYGGGGNGKGVLFEALKAVLGSYAGKAPAGFLMANQFQAHPTELADLAGKRLVICSEVNEDDKFDEQKVKELTGGDTVKARFMRQDFFEFPPSHHLWLMGNNLPAVETGGDAFWRRCRLIPFTNKVPESAIVEDLQGILAREHGAAVLNWIIAGAVEFGARGLQEPGAVKAATAQYAEDVDTVGRFLEDECLIGPSYVGQAAKVTEVREAYERWCEGAGERAVGGRAFSAQLARHGVRVGRNAPKGAHGARMYGGIMLQPRAGLLESWGGDHAFKQQ